MPARELTEERASLIPDPDDEQGAIILRRGLGDGRNGSEEGSGKEERKGRRGGPSEKTSPRRGRSIRNRDTGWMIRGLVLSAGFLFSIL